MCGTPRPDGAIFCMNCGSRLPEERRLCPTCGQAWPIDGESAYSATAERSASAAPPPAPSASASQEEYSHGAYSSAAGSRYFDGTGWFEARELPGGIWIPEPSRPTEISQEVAGSLHLVYREPSAPPVTAADGYGAQDPALPRGPALGPDYRAGRDCGNCGFELAVGASACDRCGSRNIGPVFRPGE